MSGRRAALLLFAGALAACGAPAEVEWRAAGGEADGRYALELAVDPPAAASGEGALRVRVEARAGWHLAPTAPAVLTLEAPAGLAFERARQERDDATARTRERLEFATAFRSEPPGPLDARGRIKFGICEGDDERCFIVRREFDVRVGAPAAR